jgi:hypothetical protein
LCEVARSLTSATPSDCLVTHEVDERQIGVASVDGERRDAGAHDDREREEPLADDLAERLKRADAFADALEPSVGPDGVEVEVPLGRFAHSGAWTTLSEAAQWMQTD